MAAALALASGAFTPIAEAQPSKGAPSPNDVRKAQSLFKKADELFNAHRYAEALDLFRQSYATVPSPNSHLYIARCLSQTGDLRAAYLEFQKVYEEADKRAASEPKYGPTRDSARVERDELGNRIALVTVNVQHADPSTTVKVGDVDVSQAEWGKPIPFNPGSVDVTVQTSGKPPAHQTVQLSAGDKKEVALDAAPQAAAPPPEQAVVEPATTGGGNKTLRYAGIGVAAAGVAGLVVFAITGSASKSKFSALQTACGTNGPCVNPSPALKDDISSGKSLQTVANITLVAGSVLAVGGATMIVLSFRKTHPPADAAPAAATTGEAHWVVGPSYTGVAGTF